METAGGDAGMGCWEGMGRMGCHQRPNEGTMEEAEREEKRVSQLETCQSFLPLQ